MRWLLGLHTAPFSARAAATAAAAAACAVCTGSTRPWEPRTWTIAQAAAPTFYEKHLKPEEGRSTLSPRMSMAEPPPVRVVTYNVLSSHLCDPSYYVKCDPADLDPSTRLDRVKKQLEPHVDAGAVICLQELSQQWVGELIPHLEARGYTLVTGLYGRSFNGYMGVGLAWPTSRFMSEAVDISRAADTKPWPPPPPREPFPPNPRSAAGAALAAVKAGVRAGWRAGAAYWRRWKEGPPPFDPWAEAERRANILLSARLKCKASGRTFSVSTYHMPCLFGSDPKLQVMTIHAALAARRAADFAGEGVPFVLAGDWNFKPGDAPYELFRNGDLPEGHRHLPPPREGEEWEPNLHHTLVSAYVVCNGQEPHFTNKAFTKGASEPFVGTLDYIFLGRGGAPRRFGPAETSAPSASGSWRVLGVKPLKTLTAVEGILSYPSAEEPSDHVLIWADLQLA